MSAGHVKAYGGRVRISELADQGGVPTSTVRFYERVGLLAPPARTASGYRDYQDKDAARLVFVSRARRLGLSCRQITELLPIWDGTNCEAAKKRVVKMIDDKRTEIAERIAELECTAQRLTEVRATLEAVEAPSVCGTDLSCCVPDASGALPVPVVVRVDP